MVRLTNFLPLGLLGATKVVATSGSPIQWNNCTLTGATAPIQCAQLDVPLDYTKAEGPNNTLTLDLYRTRAVAEPFMGSIMFNFGGPGGPGGANLAPLAATLLNITGGNHDLVTWDPRGTATTIPFECYEPAERVVAANTLLRDSANASDNALERIYAEATAFATACETNAQSNGRLVGTTYTAFDLMRIVDALGPDNCADGDEENDGEGLLRYMAWSYGTYLGSVTAALFPERVDRMLLDSVVNIHEYLDGRETEIFDDADDTLRGIFAGCAANPAGCGSLAGGGNRTAEDLVAIWESVRADLRERGAVAVDDFTFGYSQLLSSVYLAMYTPSGYVPVAEALDALYDGDMARFEAIITQMPLAGPVTDPDLASAATSVGWVSGIRCSERVFRASSEEAGLEELLPTLEGLYEVSPWFGETLWNSMTPCAQWPFEAKEAYRGDFYAETRNPLLFVNGRYDPITPLASAHNASASFPGSVVLQHNGFGHQTFMDPSDCTNSYIAAYFVNGTLPPPGTVCEPNAELFTPGSPTNAGAAAAKRK